jgi:flagellar basal body-associated protein FliL
MEEAAKQVKGESKSGRARWRRGVAAALVLLLAAAVAWSLVRHRRSVPAHKVKAIPQVRAVLHLEPFLVNLADSEGDRFLRIGIDLGLEREGEERSPGASAGLPIARTRDTILMVLTTCKADALLAPEGKVNLKNELTQALRDHVPGLGVQEIYFTEFLVQR